MGEKGYLGLRGHQKIRTAEEYGNCWEWAHREGEFVSTGLGLLSLLHTWMSAGTQRCCSHIFPRILQGKKKKELSDSRTVCTVWLEEMASIEWDGGCKVKRQTSTQLEAGWIHLFLGEIETQAWLLEPKCHLQGKGMGLSKPERGQHFQ